MKRIRLLLTALIMTMAMGLTAFAGQWKSTDSGWQYDTGNGASACTCPDKQSCSREGYLFGCSVRELSECSCRQQYGISSGHERKVSQNSKLRKNECSKSPCRHCG